MRLEKPLLILLLVVLGVVVLSQFLLPSWVEEQLAGWIGRSIHTSLVEVEATSFPSIKLLWGDFDLLRVDARQAKIGELEVSGFLFDARGVAVDPAALLLRRRMHFRHIQHLKATIFLSEEGLNRYFKTVAQTAVPASVQLLEDKVVARATVTVLGMPLNLRVEGHFVLAEDGRAIRFQPQRLEVQNSPLPPLVLQLLRDQLILPVELRELPVPIRLTNLRLEEGRLYLFGEGGEE